MANEQKLICDKCKVELKELDAQFSYLGKSFRHKVLRCPECGQISLPEDLVNGRMADVEKKLEDK
ncbi:MAG: DVU_1557 family redox protein [Anaerovoracaceae bacterium]|jgi:uncharacterized protein with PIN domain